MGFIPGSDDPNDPYATNGKRLDTSQYAQNTTVQQPAAAAPMTQADKEKAAGIADYGNNLVFVPSYGGVVDRNNPIYTNAMAAYNQAQPQVEENGGYLANTPPAGTPTNQQEAAKAASTYSSTPAAAPTQNTTNQGSQDIYRNALIAQMTQDPIPGRDDAAVRAQVDPYRAAMDRQVNQQVRADAERAFASGQDYGNPERLAAAERAGQQSGLFESQIVGRELQNRRDQIKEAIQQFGSTLSGDQMRALQKQLADLDAQIKRESLAQSGSLGAQDIGLRRDLGTGQLNLGLLGLLLNNQQFNDSQGLQAALAQAGLNRDALLAAMGG